MASSTLNPLNPPAALAVCGALTALGATIGFLSGSSGPDSTVLAALLPSVLSVIAGSAITVLLVKEAPARNELLVAGSIGLTIFSAALMIGTYFGSNYDAINRENAFVDAHLNNQNLYYDRLWLDLTHHHRRLERCLNAEARLNNTRKKLNLPPLSPAQICPPPILPVPNVSGP